MFQVRIHGRGGQGVVTAAEMLSIAAFDEGRHAQAFPSFGSERTGAPVVAFCRLADKEIRLREPIMTPDALIIQDSTLLHQVDVFAGLKKDGYILINTTRTFERAGPGRASSATRHPERLLTVSGHRLSHEACRATGAQSCRCWAALPPSGMIKLESVALRRSGEVQGCGGQGNMAAATEAYEHRDGTPKRRRR
jgi:pyruvate ferredoxin oxidoreductase gamma subunit